MKNKRHITGIDWDTDGKDVPELPSEADVPADLADEEVADWLSDQFGFLVTNWTE